jgi:hypothetical protein
VSPEQPEEEPDLFRLLAGMLDVLIEEELFSADIPDEEAA